MWYKQMYMGETRPGLRLWLVRSALESVCPCKHENLSSSHRSYILKAKNGAWWHVLVIQALWRWKQTDPWGPPARPPSLRDKLQANEQPYLRKHLRLSSLHTGAGVPARTPPQRRRKEKEKKITLWNSFSTPILCTWRLRYRKVLQQWGGFSLASEWDHMFLKNGEIIHTPNKDQRPS